MFKISQEAIDEFINYSECTYRGCSGTLSVTNRCSRSEFKLPITNTGPRVVPGQNPLGHNQSGTLAPSNPMAKLATLQFVAGYEASKIHWDSVHAIVEKASPGKLTPEQESVLERVPREPGLRLEAPQKSDAQAAE